MPQSLEERLKASADYRGYTPGSERYNAYVYGTMRRIEEQRKKRRSEGARRGAETRRRR